MKSKYIQPKIMVCKIEETEILAGSGTIEVVNCGCHAGGKWCDGTCTGGCNNHSNCTQYNKTKETLFEPNYFYDE